jgi:hypothetical protein
MPRKVEAIALRRKCLMQESLTGQGASQASRSTGRHRFCAERRRSADYPVDVRCGGGRCVSRTR